MPFDEQLSTLSEFLRAKIEGRQSGVPTLWDNAVLRAVCDLRSQCQTGPSGVAQETRAGRFVRQYLDIVNAPRFVRPSDRRAENMDHGRYTLRSSHIAWSQGSVDCLTWRNMPLFKTCFDAAIYPMVIFEVRPRTIFEIGSGTGASAIWFADLLDAAGIRAAIYSLDFKAPIYRDPRVSFIMGDCRAIQESLTEQLLRAAPPPWIFVDDANVNTLGILEYIRPFLHPGDYIILEDSGVKVPVLNKIADCYDDEFFVDTKFTDFYGRNVTACQDSILRRR